MSSISFENYLQIASLADVSNTEAAGRLAFQHEAERRILSDVLVTLDVSESDALLEIGSGPGNLLVPLSNFCAQAAGIDNEGAITRLKKSFCQRNRNSLRVRKLS